MTELSMIETHDITRARLVQVFRYLQALHQLRNPIQRDITAQPWVLWFQELPEHPCIRRGQVNTSTADETDGESRGDDFLLKVGRPHLTPPPEPPQEIVPWLLPGWQQIDARVTVQPAIPDPEGAVDAEGEPLLLHFDVDPWRQRLLEQWRARRDAWVEAERPARRAMSVFEKLYALHAQLGRESERLELMVGDGLLTWTHSSGLEVQHPVLLMRVQVQFNPALAEFTVTEAAYPPELYTALFRSLPDVSAAAIAACREDLEQNGWHPLGGDDTNEFLRRLVTQLSPYGHFQGESIPAEVEDSPAIARNPVLFLRHRTLGFGTALEAILEDVPEQEIVPAALTRLVGIDAPEPQEQGNLPVVSALDSPNGEDEQVFLSKPANAEQVEIARRLEQYGAVLVQGPPGTGKTHTIANLLGHLLAQGKRVLVTSHTAKALKVLRQQVVEPLQPLCVSVLDDNSKQMENAVDAITERLAYSDAEALEREAAALLRQREGLLQQLRQRREQLAEARYEEYRPLLLGEKSSTPSEAARALGEKRETAGWIPAPVVADAALPLSADELSELYRSNGLISERDEQELALALPDPALLLPPADFERLAARQQMGSEDREYRRDLWSEAAAQQPAEALEALSRQLEQAGEALRDDARWRLAAIAGGRKGGASRQAWDDLLAEIEQVVALAAEAQPLLWRCDPVIEPECLPGRVAQVLDEICAARRVGGKLSGLQLMAHRDWKVVIEGTRVKRRPPELPEHFEALRALAHLQAARADLVDRWQRQMTPLGAPDSAALGPEPERACQQYVPLVRACLDWFPATWEPLEQALQQQALRSDALLAEIPVNLAEHGDLLRLREAILERLPAILKAELYRRRSASDEAKLRELRQYLQPWENSAANAEVVQQVQEAVATFNAELYRAACERLAELYTRRGALQQRQALLARLEQAAPAWAAAVRERQGLHGGTSLPGNAADAWAWRQLDDELDRRTTAALEDLQAQLVGLSHQIQRTTGLLVEQKAWAAQVRRTTQEQQRALQGWKQLVQRAGKGKGKRAPRLLAEARRLMPTCQSAVPVWIMPLSRVVENFDPKRNRFDVVIIDEASQADLMALAAVYMTEQVVIVGDHEQVSPTAVGQRLDEVQRLIDEHLGGIPNAMLYDGQFSIYDLAQTTLKPICLREHFRCVSPIIEFSNRLSYEGRIRALRDASQVQRHPPTVAYRVEEAAVAEARVNEAEARAVASLVVAATEQPAYEGATFGVISMVGEEQALRIDMLLQRYLSPAEYAERRVQCGNAAHFQGDERDVVFLSMVDTLAERRPLPMRLDGPGNLFRKRFNVAASRARDQLWVVYSLNPETDLKPGDIRRRLIQYAQQPQRFTNAAQPAEEMASDFERQVMQRLEQAGYRVTPKWPVGAFRIDLVVEGSGKRLAIACDGDHALPREQLAEDMAQQAILERLGWRFARVRGSQFFRDPERAMEALFKRLRQLEIHPEAAQAIQASASEDAQALKRRIIQRAAELRQEWAAQEEEGTIQPPQEAAFPAAAAAASEQTAASENQDEEIAPEPRFYPGDQVQHEQYGTGRVVSSRMIGEFELVEVEFARQYGKKLLEATLTRLEKVSAGAPPTFRPLAAEPGQEEKVSKAHQL